MKNKKNKISTKTKFLNFITFGHLKRKALRTDNSLDNSIQYDTDYIFNLLGGIDNLDEYKLLSSNSLKIIFVDLAKVDVNGLKEYTNSVGIMKTNNSILITSKDAKVIYELIVNYVQKEQEK